MKLTEQKNRWLKEEGRITCQQFRCGNTEELVWVEPSTGVGKWLCKWCRDEPE